MLNTVLIEDSDDAAEKLTFLLTRYCADKINLLQQSSSLPQQVQRALRQYGLIGQSWFSSTLNLGT